MEEPKLLNQMQEKIRTCHLGIRTERVYIDWNWRYILIHKKRQPMEMGAPEIKTFLTHLAEVKKSMSKTDAIRLS